MQSNKQQNPIQLRETALQNLEKGKQLFQQYDDLESKKQGLKIFIDGIEKLHNYMLQEQKTELKQQVRQKLSNEMTEAEQMKKTLSNLEVNITNGQKQKSSLKNLINNFTNFFSFNKQYQNNPPNAQNGNNQTQNKSNFPQNQNNNQNQPQNAISQIKITNNNNNNKYNFTNLQQQSNQLSIFGGVIGNRQSGDPMEQMLNQMKQTNLRQQQQSLQNKTSLINNQNNNNNFNNNNQHQLTQQQQIQNIQQLQNQSKKYNITWDDIAGLESAKEALKEAVIMPLKFPKFFQGPIKPWSGILLYGPPGTGKTQLAKACAHECGATFIAISNADIISKFVGESEKQIKQIFDKARQNKPCILFIDELDSILSDREQGEKNEASARVKTQFLIEMQGIDGQENQGLLILGATNLPWSLDPAVRRRFEKKIYIPLPDEKTRESLFQKLTAKTQSSLKKSDFKNLAKLTQNYSGADISILVREACYQPIRKLQTAKKFIEIKQNGQTLYKVADPKDKNAIKKNIMELNEDQVLLPDVSLEDFQQALQKVKPSVAQKSLQKYEQFTQEFGQE
ncbi:P-loop containing nucleoside triphosphate hydrolase [Pseudocohnilembus persalinus]|uniref:p-loop containing nucleoside triphosphate hydrolase n=1 Tax=Pseudocohnilembus persalinus TaxID=266149 RepID=A0A0V0R906_PSEPJ|nr:P-loop containing nucleoside triphosphate hydrolase [Pseudocohnilembus persalinus]|eukprot:KRX10988.1 P-loop containing nucleoside triphosphate hydrolase [Pseudocohnilembus persalinus]